MGSVRPLVERLAEFFNDFSQVHDVFLDDASSLRFAGSFARAKLFVGWFAIVLFRVRHHASRFSLCPLFGYRSMIGATTLGGKPYVVAAYVCTPLVTIALDDLKDGAHIKGKAIAELGYGNTPADMISYSSKDPSGKPQDMLCTRLGCRAEYGNALARSSCDTRFGANAPPL
jgi:hypothetical protein